VVEQVCCTHSLHAECVQCMRDYGAVAYCPFCRREQADARSVQWLVDEAVTLIIQTGLTDESDVELTSPEVKAIKAYSDALFEEASNGVVGDGTAHHNLGQALETTGALEDAVVAYKKAVLANATDVNFQVGLGSILGQVGDTQGAIGAYRAACHLDPRDSNSQCSLGVMLQQSGDSAGATSAFRAAVAIDPSDANAQSSLGMMLVSEKDFDGAILAYKASLVSDPLDAETHCGLADAQRERGNLDAALASYMKAVELDPSIEAAHSRIEELMTSKRR